MTKVFTTAQVREMAGAIFSDWGSNKDNIKLSGRALYYLIALKKQLEQKLIVIEETLATIANQHGGQTQENGSIFIPAEQRAEANKAFIDIGLEEVTIEYDEIIIDDDSVLPVALYEALFDFIKFKE